jgi:putative heme-binding domain-containing protein
MKKLFIVFLALLLFMHHGAASQNSNGLDQLVGLLVGSSDSQFQLDLLKGISEALKGRRDVKEPKGWREVAKSLSESSLDEVREISILLSLKFGSQVALDDMRNLLIDTSLSSVKRKRALLALVEIKDLKLPALLIDLLNDETLQQPAVLALAAFDKPEISTAILSHLPKLKLKVQHDALSTMASRLTYATELMAAIDNQSVDAELLSADVVRQLRAHNDPKINRQLERFWGISRSSSVAKLDEIKKYKRIVEMGNSDLSNLSNGRVMFNRVCASCHKLYGEGGEIGPDLTGSDRKNLHYILSNVIDPNAEIPNDYRTAIIRMKDNRVLIGVVRSREPKRITVVTPSEVIFLPKRDVTKIDSQNYSIMPEGLIRVFKDQELRDLISYLGGDGQVPLP